MAIVNNCIDQTRAAAGDVAAITLLDRCSCVLGELNTRFNPNVQAFIALELLGRDTSPVEQLVSEDDLQRLDELGEQIENGVLCSVAQFAAPPDLSADALTVASREARLVQIVNQCGAQDDLLEHLSAAEHLGQCACLVAELDTNHSDTMILMWSIFMTIGDPRGLESVVDAAELSRFDEFLADIDQRC